MRYLVSLAAVLVLIPGCVLVFDGSDRGGGDDDVCAFPEPAIAPAALRNPQSLTCDSFGGFPCNPECGPCPAFAETAPPSPAFAEPTPPLPSWGICGSACEALGESACEAATGCRVVKDAACAMSGDCATDFLGCFPTDHIDDPALDCFEARDGFTCSQSAKCTAYHFGNLSGTSPQLGRFFAMCAPEGRSPGACTGAVVCDRAAPSCPTDSKPGIAGGCYTGACIPVRLCDL